MNHKITAQQLFDRLQQRFDLSWVAGQAGHSRAVESSNTQTLRPSLAGFLNLIHPNNIQVLGLAEIKHLDALEARKRWQTIAEIIANRPTVLIVADAQMLPEDLIEGANESNTPLWVSPKTSIELLSHLQHQLSRELARQETIHGVYLEVFSVGVLIVGDSGSGKSELALELISRGHRLIADDAPKMTLIAPDVIDGTCPELLQDCLEVRGLGVLNIRAMFGDSAIKSNKYLKLIIQLQLASHEQIQASTADRLRGDFSHRLMLGVQVPAITLPVAPGRNIAVLVEAAVRNYSLKIKGYDSAAEFLARHDRAIKHNTESDHDEH